MDIIDNQNEHTLGTFLAENIQKNSSLSFVTAFFTIFAYHKLKISLDDIQKLRLMFGAPQFINTLDPTKDTSKSFIIENTELKLAEQLHQSQIARECSEWIKNKVAIRSMKDSSLLHGKMYHINNEQGVKAVLGSSNFTSSGVGLSKNKNIELNIQITKSEQQQELLDWFDAIWESDKVEDVKENVLDYLNTLYKNYSPQFVYFKTLFHIFEDILDQNIEDTQYQAIGFKDTKIWGMLYQFQKDAVEAAINKILHHNGCIIADSVGLGKTFEALAIIKYFELRNDRVLVLCPKKLRNNWITYTDRANDSRNILQEDRFHFTVLSHTDLGREKGIAGDINLATFNWGNYDLVVIDESHNFRNRNKNKIDEQGQERLNRYNFLMERLLKEGVHTKVLLLSATPLNTKLRDLENQIKLITHDKDDQFSNICNEYSMSKIFGQAQRKFDHWTQKSTKEVSALIADFPSDFFTLLDTLTIARSRKHIKNHYSSSLKEIGEFPKRLKPLSFHPKITDAPDFPTFKELNTDMNSYKLSMYKPSHYLEEKYKALYPSLEQGNLSQKNREDSLIGMMKMNFMKRLESSIYSFNLSIGRTISKIKTLLHQIEHYNDEEDICIEEIECSNEGIDSEILVGNKLKFHLGHLNLKAWKDDLEADLKVFEDIQKNSQKVTPANDLKLKKLLETIQKKPRNDTGINKEDRDKAKKNNKVLIFTAFSDTAEYLYDFISQCLAEELHVALVTGSGRNASTFTPSEYKHQTDFDSILTNFSPRSKKRELQKFMPQNGEIDILIATDCISEGQNLQDCDYLINYDIHWNPVRIIQRFGRVDRLGSTNTHIQMVNFWPTEQLDDYINLRIKVENRMELLNVAAAGEDSVLSTGFNTDVAKSDSEMTKFRQEQLRRLQDEVVDLEDFKQAITLESFSLNDFRMDLLNYLEKNREVLENAPLGLYALVPSKKHDAQGTSNQLSKGVIFCFQQKVDKEREVKNSSFNVLYPYYLVYVSENNEIKFGYTNAQKILSIYQKLASDSDRPFTELCTIFDKQTDNGANMKKYEKMLSAAVDNVIGKAAVEATKSTILHSGRRGLLLNLDQSKNMIPESSDNFLLVSWLIITDT